MTTYSLKNISCSKGCLVIVMLIASTPARSDWMMVDANDDATVLVQLSDYLSQPPKANLTFLMNFNEATTITFPPESSCARQENIVDDVPFGGFSAFQ